MIALAVRAYAKSGLSIIPINPKTKRPYSRLLPQATDENGNLLYYLKRDDGRLEVTTEETSIKKGTWEPYQRKIADSETLARWLASGIQSIAVVCGAVSGGLEILDFDVEGYYERWIEAVGDAASGLPTQRTGGGGVQVGWRCPSPDGNLKLAWHPDESEKSGRVIAIETRGEGGYALLPPSIHPSGNRYELMKAKFSSTPTISQEDRDVLIDAARGLCQAPRTRQEIERGTSPQKNAQNYTSDYQAPDVIEEYNRANSITDALSRQGYTPGSAGRWCCPGHSNSDGVSVDASANKSYHFSSNDPLESTKDGKKQPRDPFDVYVEFEHRGDYAEAMRTLGRIKREAQRPSRNGSNGNHNMDNYHVDAPQLELDDLYMPPPEDDCIDDFVMAPEIEYSENASSPDHPIGSLPVDEIIEKIKVSNWDEVQDNLFDSISRLDSAAQRKIQRTLQVEYSGLATKTDINSFLADCRRFEKERKMAEKTERAERRMAELTSSSTVALQIIENNRDHNDVVDDALAALLVENQKNMNYPVAYVRGGLLTRVSKDESDITLTQEYKEPGLSYVMAKAAKWIKVGTDADGMITERSVTPPSYVVKTVLDMPEYADFPPLAGITNAPTFGAKGRLHDAPGYDIETKLFYANGIDIGDTEPTAENVEAALHMIRVELLGDFPFKDDASAAHALALTLLPFVRPMVSGPTPLHLIDSPTPGTGKGLLVEACSIPGTGGNMPATQAGRDPEEWRKRITSCLLTGASHISIDNISEALDSGELASALTQPIWSDRMLGANKEVRIPIRTIWVANGNNVVPSEEIARRIIWIRLDANAEQPWERNGFRHDNLISWAKENRAELVTACVTIVRAWVDKGMKAFGGKRKGSFENWSEVLGGILEAVGIEGFLANDKELFETTANASTMLTAFVEKWWELYGDTPVKTSDLFKLASIPDPQSMVVPGEKWYGLLDEMLGSGREHSRKTRLGIVLKGHRDKVIGDLKIMQGPIMKGTQRWLLSDLSNA